MRTRSLYVAVKDDEELRQSIARQMMRMRAKHMGSGSIVLVSQYYPDPQIIKRWVTDVAST